MMIKNKRNNGHDNVVMVFENTHKVHQFAALINLGSDDSQGNRIAIEETKEELSPQIQANAQKDDMRILSVTWNMGGAEKPVFEGNQLPNLLPDVDKYDLVFVAS